MNELSDISSTAHRLYDLSISCMRLLVGFQIFCEDKSGLRCVAKIMMKGEEVYDQSFIARANF